MRQSPSLRRGAHRSTATLFALALAAISTAALAQPGVTPTTGSGSGSAPGTGTGSTAGTALPGAGTGSTAAPGTGTGSTAAPGAGTGSTAAPGTGTGSALPGTGSGALPTDPTEPPIATAETVDPEQMPVNLRLRRLEQRVQALKERAWRAKARTTQLKEAVIGGGVGAQATLIHVNKMGSSFRLTRLVYALDGTQIFSRSEETTTNLYKSKSFDILTGPISPGSHSISVLAIYRGHGYGVFKYLNKYTFTVRASHTFTAAEGKATRIEASGYEKGGRTTPLEKRPAIDFKVTAGTGEK